MNIEKGLTLSQFVDYIIGIGCRIKSDAKIISYIEKYNNFLKQPLKKEMFVNKNKPPIIKSDNGMSAMYNSAERWKESEKKVIFKGWKQSKLKTEVFIEIRDNLMYSIEFSQDGIIFYINEPYGCLKSKEIKTIEDLVLATKGKLELKNVEL